MTTVAFVSYVSGGVPRRVGPLPMEHARPMANELSRQEMISDVRLEEWCCTRVEKVERPA
jgi:hypothetical protein